MIPLQIPSFPYGHPVAAYVFFLVLPSLLPFPLPFFKQRVLETLRTQNVTNPVIPFFLWCESPQWAMATSFFRFLDHTQRRITVGRTPLDEWSARHRDPYLTTHNTHNRQTSMSPVGFEPTISAGERQQTHALDRAATGTGILLSPLPLIVFCTFPSSFPLYYTSSFFTRSVQYCKISILTSCLMVWTKLSNRLGK